VISVLQISADPVVSHRAAHRVGKAHALAVINSVAPVRRAATAAHDARLMWIRKWTTVACS
jgi:hypothetical protein